MLALLQEKKRQTNKVMVDPLMEMIGNMNLGAASGSGGGCDGEESEKPASQASEEEDADDESSNGDDIDLGSNDAMGILLGQKKATPKATPSKAGSSGSKAGTPSKGGSQHVAKAKGAATPRGRGRPSTRDLSFRAVAHVSELAVEVDAFTTKCQALDFKPEHQLSNPVEF